MSTYSSRVHSLWYIYGTDGNSDLAETQRSPTWRRFSFERPCPLFFHGQRVVLFCYTGSSFVVNSECDCASFVLCLFSDVSSSSSDLTFGTQLIILLAWNLKYGIRYFTCSTWNYCRRILWQVSGLWDSQRIAALVWCPLNKNNNRHNSLSLHVAHCPSVKLLTKWTSFNSHLHCATTLLLLFRSPLHLNFNQDPSTAAGYEGEVFLLLYLFCLSRGQTI